MNFEIVLLFAFLLFAILVVKESSRAALYLAFYGVYFGADITEKVRLLANNEVLSLAQTSSLFFFSNRNNYPSSSTCGFVVRQRKNGSSS